MDAHDSVVRIRGLRVIRSGRPAVRDLTVQVPRGQVVGLLGPSGCGKSTLMRAVVGVQVVHGGEIEVLGLPAGSPPLRHRVGYVTQDPSVYPDLTVRENLRYFAAVIGLRRAEADREVQRVLDVVDLADVAGQTAQNLSGGQLSRASLAVALLGTPELLVLDEPTVGLDPVLRRDLWAVFRRLADDGATLLISSHVMDEAVRCDRLLLMRDGALLADDTVPGVLAATGTDDVESAFLALVDRAARAAGTTGRAGAA